MILIRWLCQMEIINCSYIIPQKTNIDKNELIRKETKDNNGQDPEHSYTQSQLCISVVYKTH